MANVRGLLGVSVRIPRSRGHTAAENHTKGGKMQV